MRFLPNGALEDTFFTEMREGILMALQKRCVLRSSTGKLESPKLLKIIPPMFRDRNEESFEGISSRDLSDDYQETDWPVIRKLGCTIIGTDSFLAWLGKSPWLSNGEWFSFNWHEDLASTLLKIWPSNPTRSRVHSDKIVGMTRDHINQLKQLNMVVLRDGSWTSTRIADIYFDSDIVQIPTDIKLRIVNSWPSQSPSIKNFYQRLGVQKLSTESVARSILDVYKRSSGHSSKEHAQITMEQSVSHVQYLYAANRKTGFEGMFFFDSDGHRAEIGTLYLDLAPDSPNSLTKKFGPYKDIIKFVHPSYIDVQGWEDSEDQSKYQSWLTTNFGIATILRFVQASKLSSDFSNVSQECPQTILLSALRDNWKVYQAQLRRIADPGVLFSRWQFCCSTSGAKRSFDEACLPLQQLKEVVDQSGSPATFPFLQVSEPAEDFVFLSQFGLHTELNLSFLVLVLKELRFSGEPDCQEKVSSLYKRIADQGDVESISRYTWIACPPDDRADR